MKQDNKNQNTVAGTIHAKGDHKPAKKLLLSIGSIIILILAAVSFIFLPAMVQRLGKELPAFGYFDGEPIKYENGSYFAQMVQYYNELAKMQGQSSEQNMYYIFNSAFNSAVLNTAFTHEVAKTKYIVPQSKVDEMMLPYFSDINGNYSPKKFNDTPQAERIRIRDQVENALIYQRYYDDLLGAEPEGASPVYGLKTSSKEIPFIKQMASKERSFQLAVFNTEDYPKSEAAIFGREHADLFTKYDLSIITAETVGEAESILRQLKANEIVFDDAVTSLSVKYYSGDDGKLTNNYQYQIKNILSSEDDLAAVTALEPGSLSEIIQTSNGYSIFRGDGVAVQATNFDEQEMQDVVYKYMTVYETGRIEDYYIAHATDFIAAATADSFEAASIEMNVKTAELPSFPLNYNNNALLASLPISSVPEVNGAQTNEKFLQTAFSLSENELSEPIVLGKNVVVLRMTAEQAADDDTVNLLDGNYTTNVVNFDSMALQSAVMSDPRFENNFFSVFFDYFMSTN